MTSIISKSSIKKILFFGLIFTTISINGCLNSDIDNPPDDNTTTDSTKINVTPLIIGFVPFEVAESSGMAMTNSDKIWSHNDSGGKNELYCIDFKGNILRTLIISNATNIDWEDLTTDKQKNIYIGDFGNNNNVRKDLVIYRIPDPESFSENLVEAETIKFSFEDQTSFPPPASDKNFDVEAMVWRSDSLFLFTKDRSSPITGYTKMYKLAARPGTQVARLAGSFYLGNTTTAARVTSADIDPETGDLALLVQERLVIFRKYAGNNFFSGKITEYTFVPVPGQVEALFFAGSKKVYMTEEVTSSNAGNLYQVTLAK
jgi:hypothetical protein